MPFDEVVKMAEKYMGHIPRIVSRQKRKKFSGYKPKEISLKRPIKQARCAIGRTSYSLSDPRRGVFHLLSNILGGSGMNSRLNLSLREKYGFVYSIGSQFVPFTDTGLFIISFGTEPSQLAKSIKLVNEELRKFRDKKLGVKQLASAKEQIMGEVAMADESNIGYMITMARYLLDLGRIPALEETFARVQDATALDIVKSANDMFDAKKMSYLMIEPG